MRDITLPDGRRLAYAEFGTPDGRPVLYFHGAPSSRLEPLLVGDDAWRANGLRVIAPDRPGVGLSDFLPKRGFSQWPNDVVALADALGLERFGVIGMSGGGGYVAACAAKIPRSPPRRGHRVRRLADDLVEGPECAAAAAPRHLVSREQRAAACCVRC